MLSVKFDYGLLRGLIKERIGSESNFAKRISRSKNYVSRVFNNKTYFDLQDVKNIITLLNIDVRDAKKYFLTVKS